MLYVPARYMGPAQSRINRIVVHGTVSPCRRGQARATAAFFAHQTAPTSAHYTVDPYEVVQSVPDGRVAYGAPPNTGALHVELCDPQTGKASRWFDEPHRLMTAEAAALVARLAKLHDVPVARIGPEQLRAGSRGICGHVDVTNAWHRTNHVDPGTAFPWDDFMRQVRAAGAIKHPTTPTHQQEDDDMPTRRVSGAHDPKDLRLTMAWTTLPVAKPTAKGVSVSLVAAVADGTLVDGDLSTYGTGPAEAVRVRLVAVAKVNGRWTVVGTFGESRGFDTRPVTASLKKGQRLRVQACAVIGGATSLTSLTSLSYRLNVRSPQ